MKILVIGASGATGRLVVDAAVRKGLDVAVLAHRHFPLHVGVDRRRADVGDEASLRAAVRGCDAVISTLGPRPDSAPDLCSRAHRNLVAAMTTEGVSRLVCVTGVMIGHPVEQRHGFYRIAPLLFPRAVRAAIDDRRESERIVMASDLAWTIVRPPRLVDGPAAPVDLGSELRIGSWAYVSRSSLAAVLVDEVLRPSHSRAAIAVRATPAWRRLGARSRATEYACSDGATG